MEQAFGLMYHLNASWIDIEHMTRQEREWMLTRVNKQKADEAKAIKEAQTK